MKDKLRKVIIKALELINRFMQSKLFIYTALVVILGILVTAFSVKAKKDVPYNFYLDDMLLKQNAEDIVTRDTNITMSEINRISKLLSFFFNDIIVNKTYVLEHITDKYADYDSYEMQILSASKAGNTFEVLVLIGVPVNEASELIYEPYQKYDVVITSTSTGLKVDYLNIIEN